jgi:hypothetical protein
MENDKTTWGEGPWQHEPDKLQFKHMRFDCELLRARAGHWCGYVDIPKPHIYHGKGYDDIPAEVHGGLTYAGPNGDAWRIGFDCAHLGDLSPKYDQSWDCDATYKDINYVKAETMRLAAFLEDAIGDTP